LPSDGRLIGHCVNTAVRVCAAAGSDEILVTELVASLAAGSEFHFAVDRAVRLKGLSLPVSVRALLWDDGCDDAHHADRRSGWFAVSTPDSRSA